MKEVWILLGIIVLGLALGWAVSTRRRQRRKEVAAIPLESSDQSYLAKEVPLYRLLPEEQKERLHGLIQVFLYEISFEACGGLSEVTREMQLSIASQACLLLLDSGYENFGKLRSVLVYPSAYVVREEYGMSDARLGESWQTGSVVLSWSSVEQSSRNDEDGLNLVLHEFAHQIDQYDGAADGLPLLKSRSAYASWSDDFGRSYEQLCEKVERGQRTVLDEYGATNPAEFFSVATETFFEKPRALHREHPEVYSHLKVFYGLDPLSWEG